MEDFRYYSPEDVIYANLRETAAHMDMVCEQELAHLRELATEITEDIEDSSALVDSISDLLPHDLAVSPHALGQNTEVIRRLRPFRTVWLNVLLCMEIRRLLSVKHALDPEIFFRDTEDVPTNALGRIAYLRSSYADSAYLSFSELVKEPRAVYTHSFPSACEEVFNGLCEYCMLPLESSSEGPLNSFSRLIDDFGLKIAATCDVSVADGSRSTRFALLRREAIPFLPSFGEERYFEFSADASSPASVLTAAEFCGVKLCKIYSRPSQGSECIHFVFSADTGDLIAFLFYLFMQIPDGNCIGIYPHFHIS